MVAKLGLTIHQGSDFSRVLSLTNNLGDPIDLTGYVFRSQARLEYPSPLAFSFTFSIRNQSIEPGIVDMTLSAANSSLIPLTRATEYLYDVEFIDAGGATKRLLEGKIKLYPEVTR
jgi:hypothetical protein